MRARNGPRLPHTQLSTVGNLACRPPSTGSQISHSTTVVGGTSAPHTTFSAPSAQQSSIASVAAILQYDSTSAPFCSVSGEHVTSAQGIPPRSTSERATSLPGRDQTCAHRVGTSQGSPASALHHYRPPLLRSVPHHKSRRNDRTGHCSTVGIATRHEVVPD